MIFQNRRADRWLPLVILVFVGPLLASGQERSARNIIKTIWKTDAGTLQVFDNSDTLSQILAINATGDVLGMREIAAQDGASLMQSYFFCDRLKMYTIPVLEGYTNTEVQALSDDGKVVGYASRPPGNPEGSLTALLWDHKTRKLTDLGHLPDDIASHAQDISSDGQRIVGYSTGDERIRPCLWTWDAATKNWRVELLSTIHDQNPNIVTSNVLISPDGQRIAACITVEVVSNFQFINALCVWDFANGQWKRKLISDRAGRLADMNNRGEILMNISNPVGRRPTVVNLAGEVREIDLLPEDVSGEARGINSDGLVVGFSDDPAGPIGGPEAFLWMDDRTMSPEFAQRAFYSGAYSINERGQIAGLIDVVIVGDELQLAGPKEQRNDDPEIEAKTIGFRWSNAEKDTSP